VGRIANEDREVLRVLFSFILFSYGFILKTALFLSANIKRILEGKGNVERVKLRKLETRSE
jgi:hypothetical protein